MDTRKTYDFSREKVSDRLVSFLKKRGNESTVSDMIAGTGLPKYQVEQTARAVLDEYSGRLKVTESGELLYSFPGGMRSTLRGFVPGLRRFWKAFKAAAAGVLSFLFKMWIVVMLVGYFLLFLALAVLAIVAAFAASAAGGKDRDGKSRRGGGGFGGMYLIGRLFEFAFRMWFYSNLFSGGRKVQRMKPDGRAFYKSVFGYVFGEGDPNPDFGVEEKKRIISHIRAGGGAISLEELMAITGAEAEEANALINRLMLEYEGDPRVTDNGTIVYVFPELLRTTAREQMSFAGVSLDRPVMKNTAPFSANKGRTNGWISLFNIFNLAFGSFFLLFPSTPGMAAVLGAGAETARHMDLLTYFYSFVHGLLGRLGIGNPQAVLSVVLGIIPVAFSALFFAVPFFRSLKQRRENEKTRQENLRKLVYSRVLADPGHVIPGSIAFGGRESTPRNAEAARERIVKGLAALKGAEPVQLADGSFGYDFAELKREVADLADFRRKVDVKSFEVGKTVFDSGQ